MISEEKKKGFLLRLWGVYLLRKYNILLFLLEFYRNDNNSVTSFIGISVCHLNVPIIFKVLSKWILYFEIGSIIACFTHFL